MARSRSRSLGPLVGTPDVPRVQSLPKKEVRVTTRHHWFRSGDHFLLGHVDMPKKPARLGVVIVPPFGWDDICAYRPLLLLARSLASNGIAVLRFDLPGTGDSSGSALDHKLMAAWIRSVQDAVTELKVSTGVQAVSMVGSPAWRDACASGHSAGTEVESLVMWGASATGRALLRELRAFRNLETTETAQGGTTPPQPMDGLEAAGFLLNPETENDLEGFLSLTSPRHHISESYYSHAIAFRMTKARSISRRGGLSGHPGSRDGLSGYAGRTSRTSPILADRRKDDN